jgi:hypothetical protein
MQTLGGDPVSRLKPDSQVGKHFAIIFEVSQIYFHFAQNIYIWYPKFISAFLNIYIVNYEAVDMLSHAYGFSVDLHLLGFSSGFYQHTFPKAGNCVISIA